jgi:hypothetical protein
MPIPDNTTPMMTGTGPFGSLEMGGMFSVLKVRKDQKPGDYSDPGWFKHPEGTVAKEYTGPVTEPVRNQAENGQAPLSNKKASAPTQLQVRKPKAHSGH